MITDEKRETTLTKNPPEKSTNPLPQGKIDFRSLYEQTVKGFAEGQVVKGIIVSRWDREALIDIGYKSEGLLNLDEFDDPSSVRVGDEVEVLLESAENEDGMVVISKRKADRLKCWNDILSNATEGSVVQGRIVRRVPGGFMVDIGIEAFLPASLVDLKPTRYLDQFLGQTSKFKIVKINQKRKNIVVSRKDYLEMEKDLLRSQKLNELQEGALVKGRVKNITDFGAFVDLGGIDGLLHITDMSWGRISHPSEMVKIGQEVEVTILNFDKETQRISLGLKQSSKDPWGDVDKKYPLHSKAKGRVVNLLPYGAFVELERGIEGLVHVSEFSWTRRVNHPSEVLAVGNEIEVVVLSMDRESRKIALGIKQLELNPWLDATERHPVGSTCEGKIKNLTDYGAFVEIEPGLGGLIHISDMTWTKRVHHPSELLKKGDTVQAKVLAIDPAARKISLGMKQLEEDPWKERTLGLKIGSIITGKVSKVVNFGLFVELPNGLEGLVHASEIPEARSGGFLGLYKIGDELRVKLLRIDEENRRISLGLRNKKISLLDKKGLSA